MLARRSRPASRPVCLRASFSAAVSAVEPSFVNFTISAPSMIPRNISAHSSSVIDGPREVGAERQRRAHGLDHRRVGVPERHRAQAHAVLDELVAVGVPDVAAGAARDHGRRQLGELIVALGVGVAPARHELRSDET